MIKINIYCEKDVVVLGGGTAGLPAAISAARNGAEVIIIEQMGFLGGTMTGSMLPHMQTFHDPQGNQIVRGIAQEIIERLQEIKGALGHLKRDTKVWGQDTRTDTPYDVESFKRIADQLVQENSIDVLFHSFVSDVIRKDDLIKGVIIENKSGRQIILGKVFIDATGDGDIAYKMGAPYKHGRETDGFCQASSFEFLMGNINFKKLMDFGKKVGFQYIKGNKLGSNTPKDKDYIRIVGKLPQEVMEKNQIDKDFGTFWLQSIREGMATIGHPHVFALNAINGEELSKMNIIGRKRVWEMIEILKKFVPGFEDSFLIQIAPYIGIRESRRIMGEYVLQASDILEGREFDDNIAKCAFPIDIHPPDEDSKPRWELISSAYGIPYRCLIPKKIEGLLVAGRCISTSHEVHSSVRVTPTCMAVGEAAGTAAALAVNNNKLPRDIKINLLRKQLKKQGAII